MIDTDEIMSGIMDNVRASLFEKMSEYASIMQGHINNAQASDAAMSGKKSVAFKLAASQVVVIQKSDT